VVRPAAAPRILALARAGGGRSAIPKNTCLRRAAATQDKKPTDPLFWSLSAAPTRRDHHSDFFPPSSYTLYPIANMRYSIALTAVLAGLGAASDVLDLKKDTLKAFVEENDLALIECEHHPRPN
jgi:hypothetical protein